MIKIAFVEDEITYADLLKEYFTKYSQENNIDFSVIHFKNAIALLENYSADYDLIFMDIQLPYLNGIAASHKLRQIDPSVILIFITNLAQYAIKGYEVDALDYILKPVNYHDFSMKLSRAVHKLEHKKQGSELLLSTPEGKLRIPADEIRYIETQGHHILCHTKDNTYRQYSSLSTVESKLKAASFARCNNCYLVNLKYVQKIKGFSVTVDGTPLQISQPRKKSFVQTFTEYLERTSKP